MIGSCLPGSRHVGEIILRDLCLDYPRGRMFCFAINSSYGETDCVPEMAWIPARVRQPRHDFGYRPLPGRSGGIVAHVTSKTLFRRHLATLVAEAVKFGRENKIEKVWMILDSVSVIAMGTDIADSLGVPLISLVWDPPSYLMERNKLDRFTRARLIKQFVKVLGRSERVAVVSETMSEDYHRDFSANTIILRHGLPAESIYTPASSFTSESEFAIGFAGALYAGSAWSAFLNALDSIDWKLAGKKVVIRLLGSSFLIKTRSKANVECLGWRSTLETAEILANCDVNYLPSPFEPWLQDLARYSFPTKLSTYLATGRPLFIHAPDYASVVRFYHSWPVGICSNSLEAHDIVGALVKLGERDFYSQATQKVGQATRAEFNMAHFQRSFAEFIGTDYRCFPPGHRQNVL